MCPRISAQNRQAYLHDRRECILDAAVDVFGKKCFNRANVSDIARAAGIGKGTIYLYFKSKEEIFSAILSERTFIPQLTHIFADPHAPLEIVLRQLANCYLEFVENNLPLIRMTIAEAYSFPASAELVYRQVILKGSELLADYLVMQMRSGKIRLLENPVVAARVFLGLMASYMFSYQLLGGKNISPISREAWAQEVVHIFYRGVAPGG